ncbi:enoyl-CoA hydratase/isomerase family protein [Shinella sp. S4-D37]|uniref:enoyl-CoA hydratase/isomerase family protein n=1 Tax=Shinella sp. S4-D37 TaxID=3161999 RepID=UPI003466C33C
MFDYVLEYSRDGAVATIDLNRPDEGNKLTREMMRLLTQKLHALAGQDQLRAVVLAARGPAFCLGRDGRGETPGALSAYETREQSMAAVLDLYAAIRQVPVPVVAKVHGDALGFGAALAGACDITLAASNAKFAFSEIHHGIPPTMAMTAVMRHLSPKALAWLIYSGETVTAARAADIGLASAVLSQEAFEDEVRSFVDELASRPRRNLATIKKYQTLAAGMAPEAASDYAGALLALVRAS